MERRKAQYERELDEELQQLKDSHQLSKCQELLGNLNAQISEARRTLAAHQKQVQEAAEQEDYEQSHSMELTQPE